jgi:4-hydroxybenzoate polyprenyltransferase
LHSRAVASTTTYGQRLFDALRYSSAYLAFIAMAEVVIVMFALSLPPSLAPLVVGLVTVAVYVNDRIADVDTDAVSMPKQAAFVRRHKDVLYVLASVAYGLAVAISVLGGPFALAITLLPGAFWILYATNWVPNVGVRFRRLKDVFLLNSAVVALAWAATLTFLPLAFADGSVTPGTVLVFSYFFLRVFGNTEIPNVRDVDGDRAIGVSTLPVVLGVARTRQVLYGIDLVTAAVVLVAVFEGHLPVLLGPPILAGIAYSLTVTSLLGRYDAEGLLAKAAECEYLVVFATLLLVAGL